jgi:uncharacterized protein (DUF2132 family)
MQQWSRQKSRAIYVRMKRGAVSGQANELVLMVWEVQPSRTTYYTY